MMAKQSDDYGAILILKKSLYRGITDLKNDFMEAVMVEKKELSQEALEARRAYRRSYYAKNKEKMREYQRRHWEKVAREEAEGKAE